MTFKLGPDAERIIEEHLRTRRYPNPEAVILAGLKSLSARGPDEFDAGEIESLLSEAEQNIESEGTLHGDNALAARRANRTRPNGGVA